MSTHYAILDDEGNTLDTFNDKHTATQALQDMAGQDAYLLEYHDTGQVAAIALTT